MNGRRVLVLGGGAGQLNLIRRLKESGIAVILQDRNPDCPGRALADEFVPEDTCDTEAASRTAVGFRVDGVCTTGTDQPVLSAARAAEARGCPAPTSSRTALLLTDKEAMKKALLNKGIPVPRFTFFSPDSPETVPEDMRFPLVVKPVDSQGQRGVLRIDSPNLLTAGLKESFRWSRRGRLIAEEYHPNREVSVSGWVHDGEVHIWATADRVTRDFPPYIGLCLAHRYPSAYTVGRNEEIEELSRRCVQALGMENGPLYFQYLVTGEEGILVNECAGRLGGAFEELSLPPVCGIDPISLLIAGTLEGRADPLDEVFNREKLASAYAVPLMFCRPGKICHQLGERSVKALPGVTAFSFLQENGTLIKLPENSVQRAAYMVIHGESVPEVNRTLKQAFSRLNIFDSRGRQLLMKSLGYARNPL